MNRRNFLKYSSLLGGGPLIINGISLSTFASYNMLSNWNCEVGDRTMVIIQLKGGNDGINNLIPTNQYDTYSNLRPNIKLAQSDLLNLDSSLSAADHISLNPSLQGFKQIYEEGNLHIVQGVSYPQNNKSHFKSTDLWLTAGDGTAPNFNIPTGWIGRYLDNRFPNFIGLPTSALPDPLGIQLGDKKPSLGFHTEGEHRVDINLSGQDPGGFYSLVQGIGGEAPAIDLNTEHGQEVQYILNVENSVNAYAQRISTVFNNGTNGSVTYPDNSIGNQLKTVARLLAGGSQTKIFILQHGGFDTHVNQVAAGATATGAHSDLLKGLADAVLAFQQDLADLGQSNKVLTVTFSEFGRKAEENGNNGTDHGTLIPMYLIGDQVKAGVSGTNIDLGNLDNNGSPNINQIQHDYRQVFGTLLQDWLGASDDGLTAAKMKEHATQKLPLIDTNSIVDPSCYIGTVPETTYSKAAFCVMLEGLFDPKTLSHSNTLRRKNLIPQEQPFQSAPWLYEGTESIDFENTDIADWVLVVVRDTANPAVIITQKALLVGLDGILLNGQHQSEIVFDGLAPGEYYVSIHHKGHLAILSGNTVSFVGEEEEVLCYNFSNAATKAMGEQQQNQLVVDQPIFGMIAGDYDQNQVINSLDYNNWKGQTNTLDVYLPADADGNGIINNLDFNLWTVNRSKIGHLSSIVE